MGPQAQAGSGSAEGDFTAGVEMEEGPSPESTAEA